MDAIARRVRRLELLAVVLSLALGASLLAGAGSEKVVRSQRFEVVDEGGRVVGMFVADRGAVDLYFKDDRGRLRLGLGLQADGDAVIYAAGVGKKPYAAMGIAKGRGPFFELADDEGKPAWSAP
jgi:hypothetical protein